MPVSIARKNSEELFLQKINVLNNGFLLHYIAYTTANYVLGRGFWAAKDNLCADLAIPCIDQKHRIFFWLYIPGALEKAIDLNLILTLGILPRKNRQRALEIQPSTLSQHFDVYKQWMQFYRRINPQKAV